MVMAARWQSGGPGPGCGLFGHTGDVIAPRALVPVHCDTKYDHAAYVEPDVWVEHDPTRT